MSVFKLDSLDDSELSELIEPVDFFFFDFDEAFEEALDSLFCFWAGGGGGLEPSLILISGL